MLDGAKDLAHRIREQKGLCEAEISGNAAFHTELEDKNNLVLRGLIDPTKTEKPSAHEVMLWTNPEQYFDELRAFNKNLARIRHAEVFDHLNNTGQKTTFKSLSTAIRRRRIVPFIGAGASVGLGFPLWDQALRELFTRIEAGATAADATEVQEAMNAIDNRRYIQAGAILYDLNAVQVKAYVKNRFGSPPPVHLIGKTGPTRLLPRFVEGCIITTNFDEVIEKVFHLNSQPITNHMFGTQPDNDFVRKMIAGEQSLLKLHGHFDRAPSLVFSEQQYKAAYGKPIDYSKPLPKALRQIFITNTLLFVGCSLDDDQTLEVFRDTIQTGEYDIPTHIALIEDPGDEAEKARKDTALRGMEIDPIWFPHGAFHFVEGVIEAAISDAEGLVDY